MRRTDRPTGQDRQTDNAHNVILSSSMDEKKYKILLTNIDDRLVIMVWLWMKIEETSNLEVGLTKEIRKYEETKK